LSDADGDSQGPTDTPCTPREARPLISPLFWLVAGANLLPIRLSLPEQRLR